MAQASKPVERRRSQRYPYRKDATAILADKRIHCVVLEISTHDAAISSPVRPDIGAPILLAVPDIGALEAIVTCHMADGFDITFDIAEGEREDVADDLAQLSELRLVH